jgi:hypothetical protein
MVLLFELLAALAHQQARAIENRTAIAIGLNVEMIHVRFSLLFAYYEMQRVS